MPIPSFRWHDYRERGLRSMLVAGEGKFRAPIQVAYIYEDDDGRFFGAWATFIQEHRPAACSTLEETKARFEDEWKRILGVISSGQADKVSGGVGVRT